MIMSGQTTGKVSRRTLLGVGVIAICVTPNWLWDHSLSSSALAADTAPTGKTERTGDQHVVAFYIAEVAPSPSPESAPTPNASTSQSTPTPEPVPEPNPNPEPAPTPLKEAKFSGRVIYLHADPIVTDSDIAEATVTSSAKASAIEVVFSPSGALKMGKATGQNQGKLLAVVVNDKVISTLAIRDKVVDRAKISGKFTKAELLELIETVLPHSPS